MRLVLQFEPHEAEDVQRFLDTNIKINSEPFCYENPQKFGVTLEGCMVTMSGFDRQHPFNEFKDSEKGLHWNEFEIVTDKYTIDK